MCDLQDLMDYIEKRYVFSPENYPRMRTMSAIKRFVFAVNHSHLHMSKSLGVIAAVLEGHDHANGGVMNVGDIKIATAKMLINTLKLAQELGMSADDLVALTEQSMKSK